MDENELTELFANQSDCYATTGMYVSGTWVDGEVIQAMTCDRFIEVLKQLGLIKLEKI